MKIISWNRLLRPFRNRTINVCFRKRSARFRGRGIHFCGPNLVSSPYNFLTWRFLTLLILGSLIKMVVSNIGAGGINLCDMGLSENTLPLNTKVCHHFIHWIGYLGVYKILGHTQISCLLYSSMLVIYHDISFVSHKVHSPISIVGGILQPSPHVDSLPVMAKRTLWIDRKKMTISSKGCRVREVFPSHCSRKGKPKPKKTVSRMWW